MKNDRKNEGMHFLQYLKSFNILPKLISRDSNVSDKGITK